MPLEFKDEESPKAKFTSNSKPKDAEPSPKVEILGKRPIIASDEQILQFQSLYEQFVKAGGSGKATVDALLKLATEIITQKVQTVEREPSERIEVSK